MLKCNIDLLAPFLTELFNCSLALGSVPDVFAFITPTLKKSDADAADITQYRPISNLSVLSKLLERLVVKQLLDYLSIVILWKRISSERCMRLYAIQRICR